MAELLGTTSIPPVDPRIGQVYAERYEIVRKIGEGGMGDVYEARHLLIDKRVALKLLHLSYASRPEMLKRFQREAQAASRIAHPHIVEASDLGRTPDGCPFLVLELLEGNDLGQELAVSGPMPLGRIVKIATQVASALAAAHEKGIVHRDLKPENVFLCRGRAFPDFVKVLDFGISKFQGDLSGAFPVTVTGATLGTPYFMAPEHLRASRDVDGRADIWALGVMIYRALAGSYPFDADSYPLLFVKICTEEPPSITAFRPDLPASFASVLMRMLEKDPARRFATCHQVVDALAPFVDVVTAPRLRAESEVRPAPSVRPGGLALRAASTLLDTQAGTPASAAARAADARAWMDAGLDLAAPRMPRAAALPRESMPHGSAAGDSDVTRAPPISLPPAPGEAYAPQGSWLADSKVRGSAAPMELAPIAAPPTRPRIPSRSTPDATRVSERREQDRTLEWVVRAAGLLALLFGAMLLARGLMNGTSAVLGEAGVPQLARDATGLAFVALGGIAIGGRRDALAELRSKLVVVILGSVLVAVAVQLVVASGRLGPSPIETSP